jgi:hypothetical protein
LTHVVQQRSGPVDGTPAPGGIKVSDPSDSFERAAESTADRVMASQAVSSPMTAAPSSVQRETEEEEPLQGAFVQRQAAEEEELLQGSFIQRVEEDDELQGSFVQRAVGPAEEQEAEEA